MVGLARRLMIATAILLSPFYGLWVFGGWICDQREKKRCRS